MTSRQAMCIAVLAIAAALVCLTGCLGTRQAETGAVSGVVAGQVVAVKWTRDTQGQVNVELPPALLQTLSAAKDAATGNWMDLAVKAVAGISLAAAAWNGQRASAANATAAAAKQRADEHKADSDEAWDKIADAAK